MNNDKENLKLGGLGEVLPLLDDVVPVDVAEQQPELADDVVFGESVEVKHLHHHRRLQEGRLGNLGKGCFGFEFIKGSEAIKLMCSSSTNKLNKQA